MISFTHRFEQLKTGEYFFMPFDKHYRILLKIDGVVKDGTDLNCIDIRGGSPFNVNDDTEVLLLKVRDTEDDEIEYEY